MKLIDNMEIIENNYISFLRMLPYIGKWYSFPKKILPNIKEWNSFSKNIFWKMTHVLVNINIKTNGINKKS